MGARISYLSDDDKAAIYEAALEIMSTIGQRVHHPEALELLRAAGAEVVEPDLVKVPRELVEKARRTAPAVIEVYDRAGGHAMSLGRYNTYFGNGSAVTSVYDVETGEHRPTVLADGEMAARLCDALPQVDFVMAYAHPGDRDPHRRAARELPRDGEEHDQAAGRGGRERRRPRGDGGHRRGGARRRRGARRQAVLRPLRRADQRPAPPGREPRQAPPVRRPRHPVRLLPAPLAGGTAPITVAGHVAQGAAESLLGLVIHQLRKPGAPFLFGIGPAVLDMATMQTAYNAPEYLMGYVCAVELARWLDLPNWGYAGTTDAQVIDAQAGMEAAELTFLSLAIGSNLNHDLGYLDFGMTGSLELIVLADEFLAMNRKLFAGVEVTPETLAVDVVRDVGPGGDFLAHRHTAKNVRKAQWRPTIINRQGHVRWQEEGGLDLKEKARLKALKPARDAPAGAAADEELAARIDALVDGFTPEGLTMSFGAELPEGRLGRRRPRERAARARADRRPRPGRRGRRAAPLSRSPLRRPPGLPGRGSRAAGAGDRAVVLRARRAPSRARPAARRRRRPGLRLRLRRGVHAGGPHDAPPAPSPTWRPTAKLGHQLPAIDFNSDCMEPLDLPEAVRTRRGTHARLVMSDKAIEWVASVDEDVDEAERINEILFGAEWHARPRALIVLNTTAPLLISGETARILLRWARLGQPVCMTSCVMGGTTGPATVAGVLAVQHAEVLATLVLGQAAREGSPFVYGGLPVMASLRTGRRPVRRARVLAAGASRPRSLAHLCGLPVRAGAAATDVHAVDGRAMAESAAGLSAAVFAGAHFLFQAAGMLSSFNALSLEKYVLDADLIAALRAAVDPVPRRARTSSPRTSSTPSAPAAGTSARRTRAATRVTTSAPSRQPPEPEPFERWAAAGGEDAVAVAARRVQELLAAHEPPDDLDAVTRRQLDEYCLA